MEGMRRRKHTLLETSRNRRMDMLLTNKNAVIYGAGGAIGGAIARAFAREGAKVFLTGRRLASVDAVASDIFAAGGVAETASSSRGTLAPSSRRPEALTSRSTPSRFLSEGFRE